MEEQKEIHCLEKQEKLLNKLLPISTKEGLYTAIIEMGKALPPFPKELEKEENRVFGCQSTLFLATSFSNGKIFFKIGSDALIARGLAALLLFVYNDEPPHTLFKCPPLFLEKLNLQSALSPGRSNGLFSLFLRMQKDAIKFV